MQGSFTLFAAIACNGCVGVTNPSYKEMELNPALEELWYSQVEELPPDQRKFVEHAAALAQESFCLAK